MSGLELSAAFYAEVVAPQLRGVQHSAALLGWGSDVLGYDTARSADHGWGPRLQVFTDATGIALDLPDAFGGFPLRFGWDDVEARAWVDIVPLGSWLEGQLGVDASSGFDAIDWLLTPQQRLLGVVSGAVFADSGGMLGEIRARLDWFPTRSGDGCWPANGTALPRKKPSSLARPRLATALARW